VILLFYFNFFGIFGEVSYSDDVALYIWCQVLGQFRMQQYDPCTQAHSNIFFNRPDVQKAMHANTTGIPYPWEKCSNTLFTNWTDTATSVLPIYQELLEAGLRLWVFR
jgi:hypothetical protein